MEIESGIPIPPAKYGRRGTKYATLMDMEPGQSVFVEGEDTRGPTYNSAQALGRRHGRTYQGRTVEGGLRIWRMK